MAKSAPEAASIAPEILAKYESVIGLEVHVQLLTKTKIFCGCSTRFGDPPNTNVCPVCLGLPGSLPVLNKRAVEMAMRAALALNCTVQERSRFARKNYFYPDLPKGYQISQYELPLATGGWLEIEVGGARKRVGITRLHLEEDAAKNLHEGFSQSATKAYIDYNRCGTPLVEIVSEPDIRSPEEAYAYLTALRQIMLYTGVSDCNMEEGSLRCDANVSVRPRGSQEFGTKVEVKNLNSFRFLQKALEYEIERHIGVLESGGRLFQETRLWNQAEGHTVGMRSKERAHDYRYFPEPDLLPVHISAAWRDEVLRSIPELPEAKRARFVSSYGLSKDEAAVLTDTQQHADFFESVVKHGADAKQTAAWMQRLSYLAEKTAELENVFANRFGKVAAVHFAELIVSVFEGKITATNARTVLAEMFETGKSSAEIIAAKGFAQISDTSAIEQAAREVIAKNPENVAKYKSGNEGVFKHFVGQVMRATRGQANPQLVSQVLTKLLGASGGLKRHTYEDVLKRLHDARNWMVELGLKDNLDRFSEYESNIKALIHARDSGTLDNFVKDKGNPALMWSLLESMEVADFPQTLRRVEASALRDRLRKVLKGPILPSEEDRNTNEARNIEFELAFASLLSSAGFEVQLPKQADPDIEARLGNLRLVIECKRVLSEKRLEEHLSDASEKLGNFLDTNQDTKGLIAVDITKLKNLGESVYEAPDWTATKKGLGDLLQEALQESSNSLTKIRDKRIVGVLFYIHTPAFVRKDLLLTAARQLVLRALCPPGTPEMEALEIFASRMTDRAENAYSKLEEG